MLPYDKKISFFSRLFFLFDFIKKSKRPLSLFFFKKNIILSLKCLWSNLNIFTEKNKDILYKCHLEYWHYFSSNLKMFKISPVPNNAFGFCYNKNLTKTNLKTFVRLKNGYNNNQYFNCVSTFQVHKVIN